MKGNRRREEKRRSTAKKGNKKSYIYKVGLCFDHNLPRHQRGWGAFGHVSTQPKALF